VANRYVQLRTLAAADVDVDVDVDVDAAVSYYMSEGGEAVAGGFVDALQQAFDRIGREPLTGSLRFSYELGIPELWARNTSRFPYLILYVPYDGHGDVWRVLHSRRDIPATFAGER
jgi:toxin ParE1/3/4